MIDWKRVSELREEVGEENFDEVIDLFLFEVEDELARLTGCHATATLAARAALSQGERLEPRIHGFLGLVPGRRNRRGKRY